MKLKLDWRIRRCYFTGSNRTFSISTCWTWGTTKSNY